MKVHVESNSRSLWITTLYADEGHSRCRQKEKQLTKYVYISVCAFAVDLNDTVTAVLLFRSLDNTRENQIFLWLYKKSDE